METEKIVKLIERTIIGTPTYLELAELHNNIEECFGKIIKAKFRYLVFEHYNLYDMYGRLYEENLSTGQMIEDYFDDCDGTYEDVAMVDLREEKIYILSKGDDLTYSKTEIIK